jgi:hypothetical protein
MAEHEYVATSTQAVDERSGSADARRPPSRARSLAARLVGIAAQLTATHRRDRGER